MSSAPLPRVLAVGAHPDDIEFFFAGTLLLLKNAGCEIHMWNLANGCCGSTTTNRDETAAIRWQESSVSADLAGATLHPPLFDDCEIFYDKPSIARVAAGIREINPAIILTHASGDYMEDHQNTSRLVVTGAFVRGMPNFLTLPLTPAIDGRVRIYHAQPRDLLDPFGQEAPCHYFVDVKSTIDVKKRMLECHVSQFRWLSETQSVAGFIDEMTNTSSRLGKRSGRAQHAEAWTLHSHTGFCPEEFDPLATILGDLCLPSENN